jgi:heat shock protein HspQ
MERASFYSPQAGRHVDAPRRTIARFTIGDVVRHRVFDFRGVIFDIDPVFANSEEWYEAIPKEVRPHREQPFYHLLAENGDSSYIAYVSQQNLLVDGDSGPIDHPNVTELFEPFDGSKYRLRRSMTH